METNSEFTKSYGHCRCCSARGYHRELKKEYFFNGIREVYIDIFSEIFNLLLSSNPKLTTLICTTCIHRLREATSFRMMVVSTEKQLLDVIKNNDDEDSMFVNVIVDEDTLETLTSTLTPTVKTEALVEVKIERDVQETEEEDYESDVVSDSQSEDYVEREAAFISRFRRVSPLPTRATLRDICSEYCEQLDLLKNTTIVPQTISKLIEDFEMGEENRKNRRQFVTEKIAHIVNASTILECSNVTPFRSKSRQGFPCFFCRSIFDNLEKLREHSNYHKSGEILKILKTYGAECLVVYVDITDLKCKICNTKIPKLNDLKLHLTKKHKKKMYLDFTDRIVPYKLGNNTMYNCQLCEFSFETFGAIERHMNVHFRNYVCKDCGTGFVTRYRLKVHIKSMHTRGTHPCQVCGKIYSTTQKHKNHVNTVHKMMKRFKCTKCPERFSEYFRRQKHMVQEHGFEPLRYKCNVCEKSFDRRYTLSRHMKRDHLEERDYQCEMCSYNCFTKNELRVHMVKHNGERIFECTVCNKAYARKKTLKEHMRIHNNDRRFACAVCGQAFVQKCSLKGHLKTHHLEFNMH